MRRPGSYTRVVLAIGLVCTVLGRAQAPDATVEVLARDPAGHGLLAKAGGKTVLFVQGSPEQMGAAHGALLRDHAVALTNRLLYVVGTAHSLKKGTWFLDGMESIVRRTGPHIPPRFLAECDAMADAAGISRRDARYANLFPEMFHCSGVAVRDTATADGRVIHARVLDYMRDIDLQSHAVVTVVMPNDGHSWINHGYAGFIGTVTAMNEKGLAVGEMGGGGVGEWDGMPMSLLLRHVMERAETVAEALNILKSTPRTCEYYYVFSDRNRAMAGAYCTPEKVEVLEPGKQHELLPQVPRDTVMVSRDERAKALSERLHMHHGRIDARTMMAIIKRPVAMSSNLHNAIFLPESLEIYVSDAGRHTPACDEPYAHFRLDQLLQFYRQQQAAAAEQ